MEGDASRPGERERETQWGTNDIYGFRCGVALSLSLQQGPRYSLNLGIRGHIEGGHF